MKVVEVVVLYALVSKGSESNCRSMQPGHVFKQPLERVTVHVSKLDNHTKCFLCDYGSRLANKIEERLHHLENERIR